MKRETHGVQFPEPIDGSDFDYIRDLVKDHTSIALDNSKVYLVNARLLPVARDAGIDSVVALIRHLRSRPFGDLHYRTVEAIVTTETSFFRDFFPFEALRQEVIPEIIAEQRGGSRSLTIWSAGCSSGQEPYSIAMILREAFPQLATWSTRILASDVSRAMLEKSKAGVYSQTEINRGLPASLLVKYFRQNQTSWTLNDEVRNMVSFFHHNLTRDLPVLPPVDILAMRNVLIYFDVETKRLVLDRIRRYLRPGGLLILGTAETTLNLDERFERVRFGRAVFYRVRNSETR
jgi:chemotaxis protein methyltransferase CheR